MSKTKFFKTSQETITKALHGARLTYLLCTTSSVFQKVPFDHCGPPISKFCFRYFRVLRSSVLFTWLITSIVFVISDHGPFLFNLFHQHRTRSWNNSTFPICFFPYVFRMSALLQPNSFHSCQNLTILYSIVYISFKASPIIQLFLS